LTDKIKTQAAQKPKLCRRSQTKNIKRKEPKELVGRFFSAIYGYQLRLRLSGRVKIFFYQFPPFFDYFLHPQGHIQIQKKHQKRRKTEIDPKRQIIKLCPKTNPRAIPKSKAITILVKNI